MPPPLLACLLLLFLPAAARPWSVAAAAPRPAAKPRVFPLRARQVPAGALPRPPSKLRFHHNVSLTVSLAVGTPPQNVTMVLDTGSELSWLLCAPVGRQQGNASAARGASFRPRASRTFAAVPCGSPKCSSRDLPEPPSCDGALRQCRVSLSYADGSTSDGALATDVFAVGDAPPLRSAFGCMTNAYDSSPDGVATAGLLGMNRGTLSFVSQASTRRFSYCISDRDDAGVLLLGHSDLPFLPLNYTPMYQPTLPLPYFDRVAYSVQLLGIRVGGKSLPIPASVLAPDHTGAGQTMVDSGTQFTFLLGDAYSALKAEFLRQTKPLLPALDDPNFAFEQAFDTCFRVPAGRPPPSARLPAVSLLFKGAEMSVAGDRLLYKVPGERRGGDGVWCLTFGNADMVPLTAYVIGHHHQMNLWVEYDLERGRVGFAPVKCDVASERLGLML
ncbi:Aspartic proteinase PCS1 [Dichanthelium oligosanthes]|uniref:Aspartic proteinase PCS1 n=1 Tax=Dichanthelium oligosanthes TaxID=888268 RepID=A0A1E5WEA8_9POAL|nr:Aspartic proteinase PCS1 [Dichanthelium oligosanthes]